VSTVLEAARRIEKAGERPLTGGPPRDGPQPRRRALAAVMILVSLVGLGGALLLMRNAAPRTTASSPPAARVAEIAPAAEPAPPRAEAPPPRAAAPALRKEEPPIGRAAAEPPRARVVEKKPPPTAVVARRPPEPEKPRGAARAMLPGGPSVAVHSIVCAADGQSCSANLLIDGRGVSVRSGDSYGGVDVQLVMKDAVYVRHGGDVRALFAPR
jgi:hypothetical protein